MEPTWWRCSCARTPAGSERRGPPPLRRRAGDGAEAGRSAYSNVFQRRGAGDARANTPDKAWFKTGVTQLAPPRTVMLPMLPCYRRAEVLGCPGVLARMHGNMAVTRSPANVTQILPQRNQVPDNCQAPDLKDLGSGALVQIQLAVQLCYTKSYDFWICHHSGGFPAVSSAATLLPCRRRRRWPNSGHPAR
jgi:hypothetical protein